MQIARSAAANAERRAFAHVNPHAVIRNFLMPERQLVGPEVAGFGMMPVGEDGVTGPDRADVQAAVGVLEEEVVCRAAVVCWVSVIMSTLHSGIDVKDLRIGRIVRIRDVESRIHERNEATTTFVQLVEEPLALFVGPIGFVVVKVTVTVHVIDINPGQLARGQ